MLQTYFNITVAAEWVAFIAALLLLNKSTGNWRLFIPWLFFVLCIETIGWYKTNVLHIRGNSLPFNINIIVSDVFLLWFLTTSPQIYGKRQYFYRAIAAFVVFAVLNLLFFEKTVAYNSVSDVIGGILQALFSGYLVYGIIKDETHERSLFDHEYFWLSIGVLFSAMGSAVLNVFLTELQAYADKTHINVYGYINYSVNILFCTCLIIAFICRRTTR
ncbi:MAG TPA: hypothetical protein PKM63_22310 [Panacibacter sp.]|nr:hypothetical protein [Panacibacter sp.]HNP47047.1 hypothetical protein [Panacibacter sp.]